MNGKLDLPRTSTTPLSRSMICRSLRFAARVAVAAVIEATATPWIATRGIKI